MLGQTKTPCRDGLACAQFNGCGMGVCVDTCVQDSDCSPIDGFPRLCGGEDIKVCFFYCQHPDYVCPDTLSQELVCSGTDCDVPPELCSE